MGEITPAGDVLTVLASDAPLPSAVLGSTADAPPGWFAAAFPTATAAVTAALALESAAPASRAALATGEAHGTEGVARLVDAAVRLAQSARPGRALVSPLTAALAGDRLTSTTGPTRETGVRELVAPTTPAPDTVGSGVAGLDASGPFVGRDAEMTKLRTAWADAVAGRARTVLVGGEPGIGKTRLAAELAAETRRQGGLALFGRCDDGLAVPYQPFVEALRALARRVPPLERAPVLGRLVPELAPPGMALGAPDAADAELNRWLLYEAVTSYLSEAAAQRPLMLVLDDLHWATTLTVALVRHVVRGLAGAHLCVVATFRSTELAGTPFADCVGELVRLDGVQQLSLGGLDESSIAALIQPSVSAADLLARTRGNPLFVRELAAHLAEGGGEGGPLPIGLRDVILQRVARLPEPAHDVLTTAAVAGDPFRLAVVEHVLGQDVLAAIEAALGAGLLHEGERDTLTFSHALVRDALTTELLATRRTQLHLRVARAIEALPGADAHAEALAHHYSEGAALGGAADAARWAQIAGHRALERLAFEEALHLVDLGLDALTHAREPQHTTRGQLLLIRSTALAAVLDQDGFRAAAAQASEAARSAGDAYLLAAAAIQYNRWVSFGQSDVIGRRLLDDSLAAVAASGAGVDARAMATQAQLLASRARYLVWSEYAVDDAARNAEQARRWARDSGDDAAVADAAHASFVVLQGSPDARGQLAAIDEALGAAQRVGQPRALWYEHRAESNLRLGRREEAEDDIRHLAERAAGGADTPIRIESVLLNTTLAMLDGQWEKATALANEGLAIESPWWEIPLAFSSQLAIMAWEQDGAAELIPLLQDVADQHPEVPTLRAGLAMVSAEAGERVIAEAAVAAIADRLELLPHGINRAPTLCMLAGAVVALGDRARAAPVEQALLPHAGLAVVYPNASYCVGAADRFLAMLALTLDRADEAVIRAEAAVTLDQRLRSAPLTARSQCCLAHALVARAADGDVERARTLAADAHTAAVRLRMQKLAEETESLRG